MSRACVLAAAVALTAATLLHGQSADRISTFFVGRLRFAANDGDDCGDVGHDLIRLVSRTSAIHVQEERKLRLADDGLFETPFLFMNGHNDFVLSAGEIDNLRRYLTRGGFIFASGCCTNPDFPAAWRREFSRILAGSSVRAIPYDHGIYRSFYKLDRVRSANGDRDIHLEGLFLEGDLVAVIGEDGLCCSFSMDNSCNRGKGVRPDDAKKLALNIAVYSVTH